MPHPAVIAQCPYYVRENQTTIFCESSIEVDAEAERYAAHIFGSCKEKTKYMKAHCGQYPDMDCPYADYMNRYYDGGKKHEHKDQKKKRKAGRDRKTEKGKRISGRRDRADAGAARNRDTEFEHQLRLDDLFGMCGSDESGGKYGGAD